MTFARADVAAFYSPQSDYEPEYEREAALEDREIRERAARELREMERASSSSTSNEGPSQESLR